MERPEELSYERIVETVRRWSPSQRFHLIQDVLKTLAPQDQSPRPKRQTLKKALGLLATDQLPPTDEEVNQWLEERRLEKSNK